MSECDEWEGAYSGNGYGLISLGFVDGKRVRMNPHRLVMMQEVGHLGRWDFVMHSCDNRKCINIEHLSVGTIQDNFADMYAKRRGVHQQKTACPRGHAYDYTTPDGKARRCTKCDVKFRNLRKKEAV